MGWLSGWQYRKSHEIEGSTAGAQTDYQVRIRVHYGSGTDSGEDVYLNEKCRADFGDIRFTKDDGETLLSYWMEEKVDGDYAVFWVKVPSIPANPDKATIYIYYGNPDAVYDGDGEQVFEFFDDFEGSSLDTSKWDYDDSVTVSDGYVHIDSPSEYIITVNSFTIENRAIHVRLRGGRTIIHVGTFTGSPPGIDDGIGFARRYNDEEEVKKYSGGSGTNIYEDTDFWSGYSEDYWHLAIARFTSDAKLDVIDRGEQLLSDYAVDNFDDYKDASRIKIYCATGHGGYYVDVDYIFVRKYVEPEPSHGSWGAEEGIPSVSTQSASDISTTSATLNGSVDAINDSEIVERGFEWGTEPGNYPNSWTEAGSFGAGSFSHQITGLSPGTTYYFRAKAKNNLGKWGYGDEVSFTTLSIQDVIEVPSGHGCIYYPKAGSLNLDLSWAKWMRLHLYGDHTEDFAVKIRLYTTENDYYEANIVVKAGEWRKYEISMDSLSEVGSPSLSNINLIAIHSPYPLLIDSDHVFLPAIRELVRARFTLRRDSPDDPSPKIKLVKLVWREGA